MTKVDVVNEEYTSYGECDHTDDWDRPDSYTTNSIKGIKIVEGYGDIEVPFDIEPGKAYFLLYAEYEDGDSFGRDSGRMQYIELFEEAEVAEAALASLGEQEDKKDTDHYMRMIKLANGKEYQFHANWVGYFSCLSEIAVVEVSTVGHSKRSIKY